MVIITWTDNALNNLNDIGEYIAKDSPKYAQITVQKLFNQVDILEQNPQIGRIVPEFGISSIRELINGNYRIIYKIQSNDHIIVLTVHHSAKQLGGSLI